MWVNQLPPNLEILSLLSLSSSRIDNVAVAPPMVFDPVIVPEGLVGSSRSAYRKEFNQARRSRRESCATPRAASGRRQSIGREDVLIALEGLSDLGNFFVFGFAGLLKSGSFTEFARLVYMKGLATGAFVDVTMRDFLPVFKCAFADLLDPTKDGMARVDIGTVNGLSRSMGCSRVKAKRLLSAYIDIAGILLLVAQEVSRRLWLGLRRAA